MSELTFDEVVIDLFYLVWLWGSLLFAFLLVFEIYDREDITIASRFHVALTSLCFGAFCCVKYFFYGYVPTFNVSSWVLYSLVFIGFVGSVAAMLKDD